MKGGWDRTMRVYDFECQACGKIHERYISGPVTPMTAPCAECGSQAERIVSMRLTQSVDSPWIKSVCDVVDKDPNKPHCQEFLRHPTRANYKAWMKGEGLRPMEPGEKPPKIETREEKKARIIPQMHKRFQERNRLEI